MNDLGYDTWTLPGKKMSVTGSGDGTANTAAERKSCKRQLYTWGFGKSRQLGTGSENTEHAPQLVKLPPSSDGNRSVAKQVSCGSHYTAVLTEDGDLFVVGCGKYGRLATGNENDLTTFTQAHLPQKVKQISCGLWHGAAVTVSHGLLVWGHRKGCGDMPSNNALNAHQASSLLSRPALLLSPPRHRVVGVSCGHNFTLAWLHDGKVLSWGSGHHGVLGHGDTSDVTAPTVIDALKDETIVEAAAGHSHSAFVTKDGKVYTCGKGKDGALGLGEKNQKDVLAPQLVTFPQEARVVQASCSVGEHHGHTLAVTEEGQVYAWGDGYKGKLGLGSQDSHYTPACIPTSFFNHERVITVCAGGIHSMAATAEGHVYTWGCGSDGRLGHPEGKGHRYLFRSDMPKQVEGCQSKTNFVSISCTYYHSAAIIEL